MQVGLTVRTEGKLKLLTHKHNTRLHSFSLWCDAQFCQMHLVYLPLNQSQARTGVMSFGASLCSTGPIRWGWGVGAHWITTTQTLAVERWNAPVLFWLVEDGITTTVPSTSVPQSSRQLTHSSLLSAHFIHLLCLFLLFLWLCDETRPRLIN